MKIGVTVQEDIPAADHRALARDVQAAGLASIWAADALGRDPLLLCQIWADAADTLTVGAGVVQLLTRSPVQHAKAAATLQESTDGRFVLGLGISTPGAMRWHGVEFRRPLGATRDALALTRAILRGEVTDHDGAVLSSHGFQLQFTPLPPPAPVYLGAMGPRSLALAGTHSDGVLLSWQSPDAVARARQTVHAAAEEAGQPKPAITGYVRFAVADDRESARAALARKIAFYWQFFAGQFASQSPAESIARANDAYRKGGADALAEALDDEILLRFGWYGAESDDPSAFLRQFEDAGLEHLIAAPVATGEPLVDLHRVMKLLS